MERKVKIKTVTFGGYDKDEVNAYIKRLTELLNRSKLDAEAENSKLRSSLEEANKRCEELEKENIELKATAATSVKTESVFTDETKKIIKELSTGINSLLSIIDDDRTETVNDKADNDAEENIEEADNGENLDALINKYL